MLTEKEQREFRERLLFGLKKTYEKLVATKRANNQDLIILKDNKIIKIKP